MESHLSGKPSYHGWLYSDLKRVKEARIQAKGRIARRHLFSILVESWAIPVTAWMDRRMTKTSGN